MNTKKPRISVDEYARLHDIASEPEAVFCDRCDGSGSVDPWMEDGVQRDGQAPCPKCLGTGFAP